jgi:uncharacterized protein YxeA
MNKRIVVIIILLFLVIVSIFIVYRYIYNKPHPDFASAKVDASLNADSLYQGFKYDATLYAGKFTGKVVEISGTYTKAEKNNKMVVIIFVFNQGDFGDEGIRCTLLPGYKDIAQLPEPGTFIKIKGLCTGYNETDVIFENCTLTN